jgi:hypothetical protein
LKSIKQVNSGHKKQNFDGYVEGSNDLPACELPMRFG